MSLHQCGSEGLICQLRSGVCKETSRWPDIPTPKERLLLRAAHGNGESASRAGAGAFPTPLPTAGKRLAPGLEVRAELGNHPAAIRLMQTSRLERRPSDRSRSPVPPESTGRQAPARHSHAGAWEREDQRLHVRRPDPPSRSAVPIRRPDPPSRSAVPIRRPGAARTVVPARMPGPSAREGQPQVRTRFGSHHSHLGASIDVAVRGPGFRHPRNRSGAGSAGMTR